MEKAQARKETAATLFSTLREEARRPASKRRQRNLVKATTLAALLYLEARYEADKEAGTPKKSNEIK